MNPPEFINTTPFPAATPYASLFIEFERAKLALMTINERITAVKTAFYENGVSTPASERRALFAEQARQEIVVQRLRIDALEAKEQANALKTATFMRVLVSKIQEAGRLDLVEAARAESLEALDAAGLRAAYRMKGPA
jgi:hypothetical protein